MTANYQFALNLRSTLARTQSSFDRSIRMRGAVYGACAPQQRVECGSRVRRSLSSILLIDADFARGSGEDIPGNIAEVGRPNEPNPLNIGSPTWARTRDLRINSPSSLYVISLHHQLLTASAQPRHCSRMQCNAGACKTAQLHFRIHLTVSHAVLSRTDSRDSHATHSRMPNTVWPWASSSLFVVHRSSGTLVLPFPSDRFAARHLVLVATVGARPLVESSSGGPRDE